MSTPPAVERTALIAGNWKMHKSRLEAVAFCEALAPLLDELDEVDLAIAPPFTALDVTAERVGDLGVGVWGQNVHPAASGAFTGEVSAAMLLDAGASGVLIGHSERRQLFGETDAGTGEKVAAALAAGLEPVLCVGETEQEREAGATERRLREQVDGGLGRLERALGAQVTLAYEPVWAIGTGKTATPETAQDAHAFVRRLLVERFGEQAAQAVRILYGGSVKPDNARSLCEQPDVDGALVGGASLEVEDFVAIARAALPG